MFVINFFGAASLQLTAAPRWNRITVFFKDDNPRSSYLNKHLHTFFWLIRQTFAFLQVKSLLNMTSFSWLEFWASTTIRHGYDLTVVYSSQYTRTKYKTNLTDNFHRTLYQHSIIRLIPKPKIPELNLTWYCLRDGK